MSSNFEEVICAARKIARAYHIQNKHHYDQPVQISGIRAAGWGFSNKQCDGLVSILERLTASSIELVYAPVRDVNQRGLSSTLRTYRNPETQKMTHKIFVFKERTHCWQRYFAAKELFHLYFASEQNMTASFDELERLIPQIMNGSISLQNDALGVEVAAFVAAIEILFTQEMVDTAIRRLAAGATMQDIALTYRIPQRHVEWRLGEKVVGEFKNIYKKSSYKSIF